MKVIDTTVLRVLEDDDHNVWTTEIRRKRMI
jgi:hypothetical protein